MSWLAVRQRAGCWSPASSPGRRYQVPTPRRRRHRHQPQSLKQYLDRQAQRDHAAPSAVIKVSRDSRGGRVSKDYRGQPDRPALLDRRVPTAVMAGMELTAAMAVMVWMALTVLLALLVHAVLLVSRELSGPRVRRGRRSSGRSVQQGRQGSRAHLDPLGYRVHPGRKARRDRAVLLDSIWKKSRSTNGSP